MEKGSPAELSGPDETSGLWWGEKESSSPRLVDLNTLNNAQREME